MGWEGYDNGLPEHKLIQYGARGTVVHKQIQVYLDSGMRNWIDPLHLLDVREELAILKYGDIGLKVEACDFKAFLGEYGKEFIWGKGEVAVYNEDFGYAGTLDRIAHFKGMPAIVDFKTAVSMDTKKTERYFKQLAAYANACPLPSKALVIVPLIAKGKGYAAPIVTTEIDHYFALFLKDLESFKKVYHV